MTQVWVCDTPTKWSFFIKHCMEQQQQGKNEVWEKRQLKRSELQNHMAFEIYKRVAYQLNGGDVDTTRAECKLRYGVPILRSDSPEFRAAYDKYIRPLTYEEKVEYIKVFDFPVTRLMGVKQMTRYIDALLTEFRQQGVNLGDLGEAA